MCFVSRIYLLLFYVGSLNDNGDISNNIYDIKLPRKLSNAREMLQKLTHCFVLLGLKSVKVQQ